MHTRWRSWGPSARFVGGARAGGEGGMGEVEVKRYHFFVRQAAGGFTLLRYDRATGTFCTSDGFYSQATVDSPPEGWPEVLAVLSREGYIELGEAIRTGLINKVAADSLFAGMS